MKTKFLASAALLASAAIGMSQAAPSFWIYNSNLIQPLGFQSVAPAGAADQAGNGITRLLADDVTVLPGYGGRSIFQFRWMVVNATTLPIAARPRVRFWNANGAPPAGPTGVLNPGTYYNGTPNVGYTFNPITFALNSATLYTSAPLPANQFPAPANTVWMGWLFDNNTGGTLASLADLNALGLGIASPVAGSSTNSLFLTTNPGSFFGTANPAGAQFQFTGATPPVADLVGSLGVQGQYFSATITLQDTDAAMALQRDINYVVKAGADVVTTGVFNFTSTTTPTLTTVPHGSPFVVTPNVHFLLPAIGPNNATNLTIELDGGPYLKRKVNLTLPTPADPANSPVIDLGTISLQNGDADGSGEIDAADVDQVIGNFGDAWPGGSGNQNSDVDNSGEVDAADIDIVIANFGGTDD